MKLRQSKGAPKIIRQKRIADDPGHIVAGAAYVGDNTIVLYDNIPDDSLPDADKKKIIEKNKGAQQAMPYLVAHEKHHIYNDLAAPNLSDLNYAYRYLLGMNDEFSAVSDNNLMLFENRNDLRNVNILSFNEPYVPNLKNAARFDLKSEAPNIILSAQIQVVKHIKSYWDQARQTIIGRPDDVRVPLSFQRSLYDEVLRYYYTFVYRGCLVSLVDYAGRTFYDLQRDMMDVFALVETVAHPKDDTVFDYLVRPRAERWLDAVMKTKRKTAGDRGRIPLPAYKKRIMTGKDK